MMLSRDKLTAHVSQGTPDDNTYRGRSGHPTGGGVECCKTSREREGSKGRVGKREEEREKGRKEEKAREEGSTCTVREERRKERKRVPARSEKREEGRTCTVSVPPGAVVVWCFLM
jgi:hypothetical protein